MEYTRARTAILNYVFACCLSRKYGNGPTCGGFDNNYFFSIDEPQPGDLVTLTAASFSEWYLSWYMEEVSKGTHLLKSVETGNLCNWTNVGFMALNRKLVEEHPQWQWTDSQFKFNDKWMRACYKKRDAYIILPCMAVFNEDNSVTLSTRVRHSFNERGAEEKQFPNWRKVLVKDMLEFYDLAVNESNKREATP